MAAERWPKEDTLIGFNIHSATEKASQRYTASPVICLNWGHPDVLESYLIRP